MRPDGPHFSLVRLFLISFGLAGYFLGWNLPNHYPLWTTFHSELAAALGSCLLFAGLLWRSPNVQKNDAGVTVHRIPMPAAARIWLWVSMVPLLQFTVGTLVFRGDAILGFLYAAGAAATLYAGHLWAAQAGRARALQVTCVTVVLGALAAAGLALAQWLRLPPSGWWAMDLFGGRPYANFGQPNLFGLLMVLGIVCATALFEMHVLSGRFSYYAALLVLGWAMLAGESRASLLALVTIVICWLLTRRRVTSRLQVPEVLLAMLVGFVVYRSLGSIEEALYLRATGVRDLTEASLRRLIWLHYWAAILEHPWLGYGFNQGVAALREVAAHVQPSRNATYAHNFVLDLMAWVGIPLGALLTAALLAWVLGWLRRVEDDEWNAQRHWVAAVWLALIVQSLLEFPYTHTFFLLPAALLAGIVARPAGQPPTIGHRAAASRPALALFAMGALLMLALASDYLKLESGFRAYRFERSNFVGRPPLEPVDEPWVLDQFAALNRSARNPIRPGMPPEHIEALAVVAKRFHLLPTRFDYAKALALNGRMAEAEFELLTLRSTYDPKVFAQFERDWRNWVKENGAAISTAGDEAASAAR